MKNKFFWIILAVAVGGLIAVFTLAGGNGADTPAPDVANVNQELFANDHVLGNKNASTTLVEYADLQCSACAIFSPMITVLSEEFKGQLRIVYRHFPLSSIHPNAYSAARTVEAAGEQGKFFEMADLLYENQSEWSESTSAVTLFRQYAEELKLNLEQFNEDYNSQETTDQINRDISVARDLGLSSTPTFYLNGEKIENPTSYEDFAAKVKEAIR